MSSTYSESYDFSPDTASKVRSIGRVGFTWIYSLGEATPHRMQIPNIPGKFRYRPITPMSLDAMISEDGKI